MAGINIVFEKIKVAANTIKAGAALWLRGVARLDNSQARIVDFSGEKNEGESNTGVYGEFNGTSSRIIISDTINGIKTASVWINPDTNTENLLDFDGGATTIYLSAGTVLTKGITSPRIFVNGTETDTISASTWQMVTVTSLTAWNSTAFSLGEEGGNWYAGDACYCKLFGDPLTAEDIAELYNFPERVIPSGSQWGRLLCFIPIMEGSTVSNYLASNGWTHCVVRFLNITFGTAGPKPLPQRAVMNTQRRTWSANDTYVNIPDANILDFGASSNFSVVCKFWLRSTAGTQGLVVKDNLNSAYGLSIQSANIDFRGAGATGALTFAASTNTIYTVVATVESGTTGKLYVNGTEEDSGTITAANASAAALQLMGYNSANEMAGFMFYAAVYNTTLTQYEVNNFSEGYLPNEVNGGKLVGYWVNDGPSTWTDRSGNGNTGTVNGTAATFWDIEGMRDRSGLRLPFSEFRKNRLLLRSAGYISVDDDTSIDASTALTVEVWVKLLSIGSEQQFVLKSSAYGLKIQSDNTVRFSIWQTSEKTLDSTTTLSADTWYHLAGVYDGTDTTLYINGVQEATTGTHTGNIDTNANNLLVGAASTTPTNILTGDINNVRVYTVAASALDVARNYRKQEKLYSYG